MEFGNDKKSSKTKRAKYPYLTSLSFLVLATTKELPNVVVCSIPLQI
jgi:hypothetical protein